MLIYFIQGLQSQNLEILLNFDLNHFGCEWAQTFTHQAEYGEHENNQYIANQRGGEYEGQAVDKWQHTETKEYLRTTITNDSVKNFSEVYNTIQYNTIQYNAMQCNAMQCNAMQCNAMQYNILYLTKVM